MRLRLPVGRSLRKERAFPGVSGEVEGIPPAGCACHLPLTREARRSGGVRVRGEGSGGGTGTFREEETEGEAARLGRGLGFVEPLARPWRKRSGGKTYKPDGKMG